MTHYINNQAMAREIRLSKHSFCEFTDERYADFDVAVFEPGSVGLNEKNKKVVTKLWQDPDPQREQKILQQMLDKAEIGVTARRKRLEKQIEQGQAEKAELEQHIRTGRNPYGSFVPSYLFKRRIKHIEAQLEMLEQELAVITPADVVFRLMTFDHIPPNPNPKQKPQWEADKYEPLGFVPFQHLKLRDGQIETVGKSHWEGGMDNGGFCADKGQVTEWLFWMWWKMTQRIGSQSNWKGYDYLEDMKQKGLMQLIEKGLKFREDSPDTETGVKDIPNPFAYTTTIINRAFTVVLNEHVHQSKINNDLREEAGLEPSLYLQNQREWERQLRHQGKKEIKGHIVPLETDEEEFKKELTKLRKQRIYNPSTRMILYILEDRKPKPKRKGAGKDDRKKK